MIDYIKKFADQIEEAINIGNNVDFREEFEYKNVVICGLGGSGIGGSILKDIVKDELKIPIELVKDYNIPNYVNMETLVICSSYSGNTEETISAMKKCHEKDAKIFTISSEGFIEKFSADNSIPHIKIPSGSPPRAMFAYSFIQLFFILYKNNLISDEFLKNLQHTIENLKKTSEKIISTARSAADKIHKTTAIIYCCDGYEGLAIRFRQQLNENSKMLCWHAIIPEMNHNEILGWRTNTDDLSVIFLQNDDDFYRNKLRVSINKKIIQKYNPKMIEIDSFGNSKLEKTLYLVHLTDWISWFLSELNNVDSIEIDVINYLKSELSKIN
tara:strand:- start:17756 stop:18739 length:984 start_codon:yes stop_codon:yes gene_type:complete